MLLLLYYDAWLHGMERESEGRSGGDSGSGGDG